MEENYSKLVDIAFNMHQSGKLEDAKLVYEKLISIDENNLDVLNLYAQLNFSLKNYELSLEIFNKILSQIDIDDIKINIAKILIIKQEYQAAISKLNDCVESPVVLNFLILCYKNLNENQVVIDLYNKLLNILPNDFLTLYNLSVFYNSINDIDSSLKYALDAEKIDSSNYELNCHMASLYSKIGDINKEILYLQKLVEINPNEHFFYSLGVLNKKIKKYREAINYFEKAFELNPQNKNTMYNIANTYKNIDLRISLNVFEEIRSIYPDDNYVLFSIYCIYIEMMDYKNALSASLDLLKLTPDSPEILSFVASAYDGLYEYKKSVEYYQKSLSIQYSDETAFLLADALFNDNQIEEALKILDKLPKSYKVKRLISYIYLFQRDLNSAMEYFYEWNSKVESIEYGENKAKTFFYKLGIGERFGITEEEFASFKTDELEKNLIKKQNLKNKLLKIGEDYTDKKLLIYNCHGLGDFIMFSRYINILKEKASKILVSIPKSFDKLAKYNFPYVEFYNKDDNIPEDNYDNTITEMLTICHSNTDLNSIPYSSGYLSVDELSVKEKYDTGLFNTNKKKIGIFWQGNPSILVNRSIKLYFLKPLFDVENTQFYSFQISDIDQESHKLKNKLPLIDLAPYIKDFNDTAALLKNLDLLITIDTSIANLAGAMGVKTFMLLPKYSEWRWFNDETTTPWYDSVKIFKQKEPNNWEEVVRRVKDEI